MEKDIEQLVLEAKPLFEQGQLSIDNIIMARNGTSL